MRIIAGKFKGRRLFAPKGPTIRPTSDRAREALFGILEHGEPPLAGAAFLDLFCGTGAVGLEANSRGAAEVVLIDNDRQALKLAEANIARLGAHGEVRLLARDATLPGPAPRAFDLVFLDPPYRSGLATAALTGLAQNGWLAEGAWIIVELAAKDELALPAGYTLDRERRYGSARFLFLRAA
ncbi:MAG TPA: 16S rRNA (guanine(966)-N(2))-methyltransferase RsmD [Geminicoccaceae bacterium]|jgi:16S rRNA (guanine966-N2)-methyltransferase|nr:16S rRNA (guanine(966)-N(2))-methyltransferase RsmD [Geminicoccaceae bacterium]